MIALARLWPLAALLLAALPMAAQAQDASNQPYELVRSLRSLQDRMAQGDVDAHAGQRALITRIADALVATGASVWDDPRNTRAAVVYALSGGEPRALRPLFSVRTLTGIDDNLLNGALAYCEGRNADAIELLGKVEPRSLEPTLGAQVALVRATLIAAKQRDKAAALLEDARLLAPGTLIEEAALRQQTFLMAAAGETEQFDMLASQYMRRFPRSVYAASFREQYAGVLAGEQPTPERMRRLEALLAELEPSQRPLYYVSIAREAVLKGRFALAKLAAGSALQSIKEGAAERESARLYQAAAMIVSEDTAQGISMLEGIDRAKLNAGDAELLDAVIATAHEVARRPANLADGALPTDPPPPAARGRVRDAERVAATAKRIKAVNQMLAKVDAILDGAPQ